MQHEITWRDVMRLDRHHKCDKCGSPLERGKRMMVETTQVSFMRGDDEVEFFCEPCAVLLGHTPPPTKAERRRRQWDCDLVNLNRKIAKLEKQLGTAIEARGCLRQQIEAEKGAQCPAT